MNPFTSISRREMLSRAAGGFGAIALSAMLADTQSASASSGSADPLAPKQPHYPAKAKNVIFLFMSGGVSHVDSFDPKPQLTADHNKTLNVHNYRGHIGDFKQHFKKAQWDFRPRGESGIEVSDLFPHIGGMIDDIALIRSMTTDHIAHYEATLGMHTGSFSFARPSMGSWVSYGLGTENQNLPSFVVITGATPYARGQNWNNAFLPGCHQGLQVFPGATPIANMHRRAATNDLQSLELDLLREINQGNLQQSPQDDQLEARIKSFETAFGMQSEAPEVFDLSQETESTLAMYDLKPGDTTSFGWNCLVARRIVERGVRFVECIDVGSSNNWDDHGDMLNHGRLAKNVDKPIAGLLQDLKQRGLLDDTLVVWTTEFGRTPYMEEKDAAGRDHHPMVFSSWMAGAGMKKGVVHGASDEYGISVADKRVHVHDFHATILHLLGIDHTRLTFRHTGRDYRLTDVFGNVVHDILT
ncbi:DUF1501 domain-containing protein [Planctomicrobium sp. SH668]|uniref:DUF1501 domain-containing protein n=1 Tax=Planctomicrobium sp. SH668 TaxID=3448126 RepID=UPI003F5C23D3